MKRKGIDFVEVVVNILGLTGVPGRGTGVGITSIIILPIAVAIGSFIVAAILFVV